MEDVMDVVRVELKYRGDRSFYIIVGHNEVMCSVPPHGDIYLNAVLTALTRTISVALQGGVPVDRVKKQLRCSSIVNGDLPSLILKAMEQADEYKRKNAAGSGCEGGKEAK